MFKKVSNLSLTTRIYTFSSLFVVLLIIVSIGLAEYGMIYLRTLAYEKDLMAISNMLSKHVNSYDDILQSKGVLNKSTDEKVLILNRVLQPVVDEMLDGYPDLGMGYYSIELDRNIAIQPNFSPDKLISMDHSRPYFKVYETGKPLLSTVNTSVAWGSPVLNYSVPIFDTKGKIIGHAWANVSLENLYQEFYWQSAKILLIGLAILLLFIGGVRKQSKTLNKELEEFTNALIDNNSKINPHLLPQLKPLFRQIKVHNEEISRLERLNLVGQMAAGIGHEIRNPLTVIKGYLQMFGTSEKYAREKETFDMMVSELDRANAILTDFLSLAKNKRDSSDGFEFVNLNQLIQKLYPLLIADAINSDQNIIIQSESLPDIFANPNELTQLLLNLVRNALEANSRGKCVMIKTFAENDQVYLVIKDEGPGIDPSILDKLGTPFLTTKEKGTGLGLSVCYNIVAKHKGTIKVDTKNTGTSFIIGFVCHSLNDSDTAEADLA